TSELIKLYISQIRIDRQETVFMVLIGKYG
ncbi:hypothetical protein SNEBB_007642, partial [Seison nebaliae]